MHFKATLLSLSIAATLPSFSLSAAPLHIDTALPDAAQIQQSNSWLEISLGQFQSNIEQFKSHMNANTKICAIMKADAYGNGIRGLMPTIIAQGIPCVGVASNAEARAVRESGFKGELIRVRSASLSEMSSALDLNIEELIGTHQQALDLAELAKQSGKTLKVHIALNDGGMGRNGIDMTTEAGKERSRLYCDSTFVECRWHYDPLPELQCGRSARKTGSIQRELNLANATSQFET